LFAGQTTVAAMRVQVDACEMVLESMRAGSVEAETRRWMVRAFALVRAAQTLPWLPVAASSRWANTYRDPALVVGLYIGYVCWVAWLFLAAMRRNGVSRAWVVADVLVTSGCVLIVGLACKPGFATTWQNWTPGPAMGAAILASVYLGAWFGIGAGALLINCYVIGTWADVVGRTDVNTLLGVIGSGVAFTVAATFVVARLVRSAVQADQSAAEALDAREAEARMAERVRQYEMLHTNVLTTLTLIGRGPDLLSPELRARCDRDAKYLGAVVHSLTDASSTGLTTALAEVIADQGALGLNIDDSFDAVPTDLPQNVITTIALAAKEALNNVLKYAGTNDAWVVATGEGSDSLCVTVTDHGRGFDPATATPGLGLSQILGTRIEEIGGRVHVDSRPGDGTYVEIRWER
jgi:signal transduction histidine kinase